jgi:asparagine synthase (glutamine-hydrolysing)
MSGIVGIYYFDQKPVEPIVLGHMVDIIAHRGRDGAHVWSEGAVGLGHRMLWTTPESLIEKLPAIDDSGNFVITADARIDNRDQLIELLGMQRYTKSLITDSDLILKAYKKWGSQCPAYLIGDFAFAIWDKHQQKLFCARDPLGVKPFYYYLSENAFIFGSEIKALFVVPEVPRQVNDKMVADYLAKVLFYGRKEDSFYQDIQELRAVHSLVVGGQKVKIDTYWSPDFSKSIKFSSNQEYAEAFREIFTESVRCRLRSAFPLGSNLSGGLDSSSVACTAQMLLQEANQPDLHTFSAIFPSFAERFPKIDERSYMQSVLDKGHFNAHMIEADQCSPLMDREQALWHGEEPNPAPNFYMEWSLIKAAREQNVRVLLTGVDGDSTVTYGTAYLAELARSLRWIKLLQEGTAWGKLKNSPPHRLIWGYGFRPNIPLQAKQLWRWMRGKPSMNLHIEGMVDQLISGLNPDFAQSVRMDQRMDRETMSYVNCSQSAESSRESHWLDLTTGSLSYAVKWLDRAAAAQGLEVRHPFCDRRLAEFCIALPNGQKMQDGWTRSILRRGMAGVLPPEVQWRPGKGNLAASFKGRFLEEERRTLEQVLFQDRDLIEPYVNLPKLQADYARYAADPHGHDKEALNLFYAVSFALWLRKATVAQPQAALV